MQISVEKSSSLGRRLTVAVPEERIESQVHSRLEDLRKTVRIDGFRQGKAPPKLVRQRFGSRIRDEIVGEVLQSTIGEAMAAEKLKPAGQPVIDPMSSSPGEGLTYTASFDVYPEFSLSPAEELVLEKYDCEISDSEVNEMIEKLREQNKEWIAVERSSQDGDKLNIDFVGTVDDEAFEGGSGNGSEIQLGSGMMIEGFELGLTDKAAGESTVLKLKFPEEYRNEQLSGKPVQFEVTINAVQEGVLPDLNEAFMEKFGVKDGDIETLRGEIKGNMEKEQQVAVKRRFTQEVMDKVEAANSFDLPDSLVEAESQRLSQQVSQEFSMRGLSPSEAGDDFGRIVRERAEKRVKVGLIMAEIIKTAELVAPAEKVRETIESIASSYEDPAAVVKYYYDSPEQLQQVEGMCLEEEAVQWIANQAKVTKRSVSFDALMDPGQTGDKTEAGA